MKQLSVDMLVAVVIGGTEEIIGSCFAQTLVVNFKYRFTFAVNFFKKKKNLYCTFREFVYIFETYCHFADRLSTISPSV